MKTVQQQEDIQHTAWGENALCVRGMSIGASDTLLIRSKQPNDKRTTALADDPPRLRRPPIAGRLTVSEARTVSTYLGTPSYCLIVYTNIFIPSQQLTADIYCEFGGETRVELAYIPSLFENGF